jgi:hypothetical protein
MSPSGSFRTAGCATYTSRAPGHSDLPGRSRPDLRARLTPIAGLSPADAIWSATTSPADGFGGHDRGAIAGGRQPTSCW